MQAKKSVSSLEETEERIDNEKIILHKIFFSFKFSIIFFIKQITA